MGMPDGRPTRAKLPFNPFYLRRNPVLRPAAAVLGRFRLMPMHAPLALILLSAVPLAVLADPMPEPRAEALRQMVRQDCGSCHGLRLTGGLGSPITPEALAGRDPGDLSLLILDGLPGTAMPGWRPLLDEGEARWIADYLLEGESP